MSVLLSYLEWNINQASNRSGENTIPNFVFKEIERQNKELVVLVEYCDTCKNSAEFKKNLQSIGYEVKVNIENSKLRNQPQNDVLIAFKKDIFLLEEDVLEPPAKGDYPEMLALKLKDKTSDKSVIVVGVRIRLCGDDKSALVKRSAQLRQMLDSVYVRYGKDAYVMILGDFNNNRTDLESKYCIGQDWVNLWSVKVIDKTISEYGLVRVTPKEDSSIRQKKGIVPFKSDHLLVSDNSNVEPKENFYNREFTGYNSEVYLHGEDFQVYNSNINKTTWTIPVGSGIPDHAMLIGTVKLGTVELYQKEALVLSEYFHDGGETYTREELILRLLVDTGLERHEAEELIDYAVTNNWILDVGNDCYTR